MKKNGCLYSNFQINWNKRKSTKTANSAYTDINYKLLNMLNKNNQHVE